MLLCPPHSLPGNLSLWPTSYSGYSFNQYLLNVSKRFTLLNLYATSNNSSPISWVSHFSSKLVYFLKTVFLCIASPRLDWQQASCYLTANGVNHLALSKKPLPSPSPLCSLLISFRSDSKFVWGFQWQLLFFCELNYICIQLNCIW